jgi:hypothetical protein
MNSDAFDRLAETLDRLVKATWPTSRMQGRGYYFTPGGALAARVLTPDETVHLAAPQSDNEAQRAWWRQTFTEGVYTLVLPPLTVVVERRRRYAVQDTWLTRGLHALYFGRLYCYAETGLIIPVHLDAPAHEGWRPATLGAPLDDGLEVELKLNTRAWEFASTLPPEPLGVGKFSDPVFWQTHRQRQEAAEQASHPPRPRRARSAPQVSMTWTRALEALGLVASPLPNAATLKAAYYEAARLNHPDLHPAEERAHWTARMQLVNAAYNYLKE